MIVFFCCVFCQAEDGIRYLVRSRGLGDVYKRQVEVKCSGISPDRHRISVADTGEGLTPEKLGQLFPVSYTHLTLPTSDLV